MRCCNNRAPARWVGTPFQACVGVDVPEGRARCFRVVGQVACETRRLLGLARDRGNLVVSTLIVLLVLLPFTRAGLCQVGTALHRPRHACWHWHGLHSYMQCLCVFACLLLSATPTYSRAFGLFSSFACPCMLALNVCLLVWGVFGLGVSAPRAAHPLCVCLDFFRFIDFCCLDTTDPVAICISLGGCCGPCGLCDCVCAFRTGRPQGCLKLDTEQNAGGASCVWYVHACATT